MDSPAGAKQTTTNPPQIDDSALRFDRVELAGAFGDLGTLLPIVVGMILINKLSPSTVFLAFGLFYIATGYYYRLPVPVQPLKAVGAIAIAYPALITEPVIGASGIIFGALLLLFALTGIVDTLAKLFTQPVVRGIQLSLGLVFLKKGIELIVSPQVFLNGLPGRFAEYHINLIIGIVVCWGSWTTRSSRRPWSPWPPGSYPVLRWAASTRRHFPSAPRACR
jgi:SulP family sulfate permease